MNNIFACFIGVYVLVDKLSKLLIYCIKKIEGLLVYIELLIEHSQKQQEDIEVMKDEIRILKGEKKRPKFKPSKLDESTNDKPGENAR